MHPARARRAARRVRGAAAGFQLRVTSRRVRRRLRPGAAARSTSRRCCAGAATAARGPIRRPAAAGSGRRRAMRRDARARASSSSIASPHSRRTSATTPDGLGEVRRARDVRDDAAGLERADRRGEQLGLQLGERRARRRATCASAPRGGAAARRARCTAHRRGCGRRRRGLPRRASRPSCSETATSSGTPAIARRTSPARAGEISLASSIAPPASASAASTAVLPPGPAHRSSHRSPARTGLGAGQGERGELRSLVLHAHRARRTADEGSGSPPPRRKPIGEYGVCRASSGDVGETGQRGHRDPRRRVVGGQQRFELVGAALGGQGAPECAHDPDGVREHAGRGARRRTARPARSAPSSRPACRGRCVAARRW